MLLRFLKNPLLRKVPNPPPAWPPPRDQEGVRATLAYARQRDPIGDGVHVTLALLYLFLLPLATAPKDIAFGMLGLYALSRVHCTWRTYTFLLRDWLSWLLLAWASWHALSILWGGSSYSGYVEIRAFRVLVTVVFIWPVIDRLAYLIAAFLFGVLVQNGVQLLQITRSFGFYPDETNRADGLLHPIHVGSVSAAAICWHLAAILRSHGWLRAISVLGLLAAGAGLIFSGSRGPWIAALVSAGPLLVMCAVRRPATRRAVISVAMIGIVAGLALWPFAEELLAARWHEAMADLSDWRSGQLETNQDLRLSLWNCAWETFLDAPVIGVGSGGFEGAIAAHGYSDLLGTSSHAHSLYFHEMASTGAVGAVILLAVVLVALSRAFRSPEDTPWSMGTPYVLIGWLVAAMFDAYHLNGHTFGLFAFVVAITMPRRPPAKSIPMELDLPSPPIRPAGATEVAV